MVKNLTSTGTDTLMVGYPTLSFCPEKAILFSLTLESNGLRFGLIVWYVMKLCTRIFKMNPNYTD